MRRRTLLKTLFGGIAGLVAGRATAMTGNKNPVVVGYDPTTKVATVQPTPRALNSHPTRVAWEIFSSTRRFEGNAAFGPMTVTGQRHCLLRVNGVSRKYPESDFTMPCTAHCNTLRVWNMWDLDDINAAISEVSAMLLPASGWKFTGYELGSLTALSKELVKHHKRAEESAKRLRELYAADFK